MYALDCFHWEYERQRVKDNLFMISSGLTFYVMLQINTKPRIVKLLKMLYLGWGPRAYHFSGSFQIDFRGQSLPHYGSIPSWRIIHPKQNCSLKEFRYRTNYHSFNKYNNCRSFPTIIIFRLNRCLSFPFPLFRVLGFSLMDISYTGSNFELIKQWNYHRCPNRK